MKITLGRKTINDHDHYIPCTLDPVFGKYVETPSGVPHHTHISASVGEDGGRILLLLFSRCTNTPLLKYLFKLLKAAVV